MVKWPQGFLMPREDAPKRPVDERVADHKEIEIALDIERLERQAARCADCGIPYCHAVGCPLQNFVPDWNDMVARGHWRCAAQLMHLRNPFPEITGRVYVVKQMGHIDWPRKSTVFPA